MDRCLNYFFLFRTLITNHNLTTERKKKNNPTINLLFILTSCGDLFKKHTHFQVSLKYCHVPTHIAQMLWGAYVYMYMAAHNFRIVAQTGFSPGSSLA